MNILHIWPCKMQNMTQYTIKERVYNTHSIRHFRILLDNGFCIPDFGSPVVKSVTPVETVLGGETPSAAHLQHTNGTQFIQLACT